MRALVLILLSITFLSACGKKDNETSAMPAMNGATSAVSADSVAQAIASAGVSIDITDFRTTSTSPWSFAATMTVAGQSSVVQMVQSPTSPMAIQSGTVAFGQYQMLASGQCAEATQCNPYYFVGTLTLNNQTKVQVGYKFYRLQQTAAQDVYVVVDAAHAMTFTNMVALLNTK